MPPASISIGKRKESGRGPLSPPKPPEPGYRLPATVRLSSSRWFSDPGGWGGEKEGAGRQPFCLGSGSAWGRGLSTALGRLPGPRSVAVASSPHPHPDGGPLGTPSADNTEALPLGGGSPGKKRNQTKRTTNPELVTATLEASVLQPPGVTQRISPAHQSLVLPPPP